MNIKPICKGILALAIIAQGICASAQTAFEEISQNPQRCGGVLYAYPTPTTKQTPAPKGYEPFYISHYGRHGSRWLLGDNENKGIIDQLEKAKTDGVLTATGEEMLSRLKAFYPCTKKRLGELTSVGERQHHNIGKRMTVSYDACNLVLHMAEETLLRRIVPAVSPA